MFKKSKIAISVMVCISIIVTCQDVHASGEGFISRINSWWMTRSVQIVTESPSIMIAAEKEKPVPEEEDDKDERPVSDRLPGMCQVVQQPPVMRCEIGSGFLCIDTPPGSVVGDYVLIRGTMDRQGSVLASTRVAVQNEYTKKTQYVDTTNPQGSGCWDSRSSDAPFCIDGKGRYSVGVPLASKGPHTVSISASRLSGESVERKVRTSRVVAPTLADSNVSYNPDIRAEAVIDEKMVMVTVDLLGDCQYCDFIGASTGGVTVSVDNLMKDQSNNSKIIKCETTVEQGGQGRFVIGVPAGAGNNSLTISTCNAATEGNCPTIKNVRFSTSRGVATMNHIAPPPMPNYDSEEYPNIEWRFKLGGGISCINMQFNREEPREICAGTNGEYSVTLKPRVGINVATLETSDGMEQFAWTFGWGSLLSPFSNEKGFIGIEGALGLTLSNDMFETIFIPFMNNFLSSDEFSEFLAGILEGLVTDAPKEVESTGSDQTNSDGAVEQKGIAIPKCDTGGGLGAFAIKLGGIPIIGVIKLDGFSMKDNQIDLSIVIDDIRAVIEISPDKDGDGVGDKDPLPLIVGFDELRADIQLLMENNDEGEKLILISSPNTDCDYKGSYCTGRPASIVPKNFVGNASPWGHFVWCDVSAAASSVKDVCKAFNSINAQTVAVKEALLDSINEMVYCTGSSFATNAMQDYFKIPIQLGCKEGEDCGDSAISNLIPSMVFPLWIGLNDQSDFSNKGVSLGLNLGAGDVEHFTATPDAFKFPSSGAVVSPERTGKINGAANLGGSDLGLDLSLDTVGALLYAAVAYGDGRGVRGMLDFDIHEPFFNDLGFDFVKECDAFEPIPGVKDKPPTLCYIRPRVMELLGSSLTSYDYFPAKQPVIMALRGSRALAPRIVITNAEDLPVVPRIGGTDLGATSDTPTGNIVELQVGGLEISFYAIKVDEEKPVDDYGNLPIKYDANGDPEILSMRSDRPDPWDGAIVSFDLSLLLGLEFTDVTLDDESETGYSISVRTLSDRTRMIITPIEGSNVTTIPSRRIISNLADQLMTAIAQYTQKESAIKLSIPEELAFAYDPESITSKLGLRKISMMPDGLSLEFDEQGNSVDLYLKVIIEQVLHYYGEEKGFTLP